MRNSYHNQNILERMHDKALEPPEPEVHSFVRCAYCDEPIEPNTMHYVTGDDKHLHEDECFHEYACQELGASRKEL